MEMSIIVPAFNEEKNLEDAVNNIFTALGKSFSSESWEIIIVNDGSTDGTAEIAERLAKTLRPSSHSSLSLPFEALKSPQAFEERAHPSESKTGQEDSRIRVLHNEKNRSLGYTFRKGVEAAKGKYVTWFPGDNENLPETLIDVLKRVGEADIITSYTANQEVRSFKRRLISRFYTFFNNLIFGLNLKYYNGLTIYSRQSLLKIPFWSDNFGFFVEILVFLLKSGATYVEAPILIRSTNKTSALKLKNVLGVMKTIFSLFWRINIKRERL